MIEHCDFTQKVSQFVDGELEAEDVELLEAHLRSCVICAQAQQSFLTSREQLRAYEVGLDKHDITKRLERILSPDRAAWWRTSITIPVPVAAMLALIVAVVIWAIVGNPAKLTHERERSAQVGAIQKLDKGAIVGLERYDDGGKAVIFKESRSTPSSRGLHQ